MGKSLITGRTIFEGSNEYLYFAGTSYLGLSHHPEYKELLNEGIDLFGIHYGSSRHSNIQLNVFDQAEDFLADWIGASKSLVTSSGTLAGQILIQFLAEEHHLIYAPYTHNALYRQPAIQSADWPTNLIQELDKYSNQPVAILTNSIDSLTLSSLDFSWVDDLPDRRDLLIVVDDSHGIGVTGEIGNGIHHYLSSRTSIPIISIASLGKALSIPAGYIAGPENILDNLYNHPLFIGSSTPSPAYLYALINSQSIYEEQLSLLRSNIRFFKHSYNRIQNFKYIPDYPVFYSEDQSLFVSLKAKNIICSSFQYPTKQSPSLTRIVVNAGHRREDLLALKDALEESID